jgi:kynurenine 3-monooxygenase
MASMGDKNLLVLGAGLCGSLLSIFLARKGFKVDVFEKRPDLRNTILDAGRSINLALSNRGIKALEKVGLGDKVKELAIPMHGRIMHDSKGNLTFQPYGKQGQYINSISRSGLNALLLSEAEKSGVNLHFNHTCKEVDFETGEVWLDKHSFGNWVSHKGEFIFGTDGAFSVLRSKMLRSDRFSYSQQYIEHGYKELSMPPNASGDFAIDPNALHIWPRGGYMMIALPNLDRSFTVTLFFPFEGQNSFGNLKTRAQVRDFFEQNFPDALALFPDLEQQFFANPTSSLLSIKCFPWTKGKAMLLGDAAHAIVPFYGQGMNAAFEDCFEWDKMMSQNFDGNWEKLASNYQHWRKPDTDAIADLALQNFIEMRDKVADPMFLLRKKIEAKIHEIYPEQWVPLYSMVTFSELRYSEAKNLGKAQELIMNEVMGQAGIAENWETLNFAEIISKL